MLILILPLELRYHFNQTPRLLLIPEYRPGDISFFNLFLIGVSLLYNVVLVSAEQDCESAGCIHIYSFS